MTLPPPTCHYCSSESLFGGVHKYLNTFCCCCNFLNIAATRTVFTVLESLKSQQLNLLHSFSEKLLIEGSTGHLVHAVSLSTVLNRIMQSSINYTNYTYIMGKLEDLAAELFILFCKKLHIKGNSGN